MNVVYGLLSMQEQSDALTENVRPETRPLIYIVDDSVSITEMLGKKLESLGFDVEIYNSGQVFLEQDNIQEYACLLLDNQMPELTGLEVQKELVKRNLDLPVIFMSGDSSYAEVVEAVKTGALYFLQKPFRMEELSAHLNKAVEYSKDKAEKLHLRRRYQQLISSLTKREKEIYQLITAGHTNKSIAKMLDISVGTVEFHRANVMKKLDASSLAELMSISRGIIDLAGQTLSQI